MLPIHAGHPGHESALVIVMAVVVVAAAFALNRDGWSRVAALVSVTALAALARLGIEIFTIHAHDMLHLVGHGLELSAIVTLGLAGYYALDARTSTTADLEQ